MDDKRKKTSSYIPVEIFLGIKKADLKDNEDYYTINQDKNKFQLYEEGRKRKNAEAITLNPSYVYVQSPYENCVMYENICRNAVSDLLQGKRHCYLTYGINKTGKKTTIFGEDNSMTNKNSRGLLYRLVEDLLNKTSEQNNQISLSYNFYCIFQNKILDFSKLKDFETSESDLLKKFETIKQERDYELELNKIPIFEIGSFIENVKKVLGMLYRLEAYQNKLFSHSTLILNLHIVADENIQNPTSESLENEAEASNRNYSFKRTNCCFCSMASANFDKVNQLVSLNKVKHTITANSDMLNLIQIFKDLQKPEFDVNKYFKNLMISSYLVSVLKNNFINPTNFRIIGCVFPGPYYYQNVKDTVMVLKRISQKSEDTKEFEPEPEEESKESVIYTLSKKLNDSEKEIDKKRNEILKLKEEMNDREDRYLQDLLKIKAAFSFEGDIKKLLLKDDTTIEAKLARKIRECQIHNVTLQNKIKELEVYIANLKREKEKIMIEKGVLENDMAMVTMYQRIKDNNLLEEKKLKMLLEDNKEKDYLKKQNENLQKQIDALKRELEEKNKQFKQLPSVLKENISTKISLGQAKEETKEKYTSKYKADLESLKANHKKELDIERKKNDLRMSELEEEVAQYKSKVISIEYKNSSKFNEIYEELYKLNDILGKVIKTYKKKFDFRKVNLNTIPSGFFLNLKEGLDKELEEIVFNINKYTYPNLFEAINQNRGANDDKKLIKQIKEVNHQIMINQALSNAKNQAYMQQKTIEATIKTERIDNNQNILINTNEEQEATSRIKDINRVNKDPAYSRGADSELLNDLKDIPKEKKLSLEDLESYDRGVLSSKLMDLQNKVDTYYKLLDRLKDRLKNGFSVSSGENNETLESLYREIDSLKEKLKNQVALSNKYKMIIQSQERSIVNYRNEQYYKLEKDRLEVRVQSPTYSRGFSGKSKASYATSNFNFQNCPDLRKYKNTENHTEGQSQTNIHTQHLVSSSTRVTTAKTNQQFGRPLTGLGYNRPKTGVTRGHSAKRETSTII